jgi:hypothetical protein
MNKHNVWFGKVKHVKPLKHLVISRKKTPKAWLSTVTQAQPWLRLGICLTQSFSALHPARLFPNRTASLSNPLMFTHALPFCASDVYPENPIAPAK